MTRPCQMQSLPATTEANRRLGLPVTTTRVCTVWDVLTRLRLSTCVLEAGRLICRAAGAEARTGDAG
jgi:maleate cis-trans isomerase